MPEQTPAQTPERAPERAPEQRPEPAAPLARENAEQLLRRLEWTVLRRLDGLLQGDYRTLLRGPGIDLADLREYQHHDDVRHIDWNVTARLQQPYVRQFVEDRDLQAWFLLDLSASIDFGSGATSKLALARAFVGALARIFTRHGNRVGALFYHQQVDQVLKPGASRLHVLNLLQRMQIAPAAAGAARAAKHGSNRTSRTSGTSGTSSTRGTTLATLLNAAENTIKRRSLVFVLSDFISEPGWSDALARLARRHEVLAVRLYDAAEMALPDVGLVTLEDAETGAQLLVDAADPAFRTRYAQFAEAEEATLRAALGRAGTDTLELRTDDDLLDALLRFCELRRQRARRLAPARWPAAFQLARASHATQAGQVERVSA